MKPKEIIELEKYYRIELIERKELFKTKDIVWNSRNHYTLNDEGHVIKLNLERNKFKNIGPISKLYHLNVLELDTNEIEDLSPLSSLNQLNILKLGQNKIRDIRPLSNLTDLAELVLSHNQIEDIYPLSSLTHLKILKLGNNEIRDIHPLSNLTDLAELSLSFNQIEDIQPLTSLIQLKSLFLDSNYIIDILPLASLTELYKLSLTENKVSDINPLVSLKKLSYLGLIINKISDILPLASLNEIRTLFISNNHIRDIQPLASLTQLKVLWANNNQINDLSPLLPLNQLSHLEISDNQIDESIEIRKLIYSQNIRYIEVANNPFLERFQDLKLTEYENHLDSLRNYFSRLDEEDRQSYLLPVKVLFLGNHASGKSTFADYFLQDKKKKRELKKGIKSTHVLNIYNYPENLADDTYPEAIIFDFGGQDYYHGVYKAFLSDKSLNIIFWNAETDKNNTRPDRENPDLLTQDFRRDYWLHQLQYAYARETTKAEYDVYLVQSHADKSKRVPYHGEIEKLQIGNEFFISLDNESYQNSIVFKSSLDYFENSLLDYINKNRQKKDEARWYGEFLNYIYTQKGHESVRVEDLKEHYKRNISLEELEKYIRDDLDQLAKQGLVLYYPTETLRDTVWLSPAKTIQHIHSKILSKKIIKDNKGEISKEGFEKEVKDKHILQLLIENKVIFFDSDAEKYIIPGYLPLVIQDENTYQLLTFGFIKPNFTLKFEHFLPFGLMNVLICAFGQNPGIKKYWRDQLLFTTKDQTHKILIKLDFSKLEIRVYIESKSNKNEIVELEKQLFIELSAHILDLPKKYLWEAYHDYNPVKLGYKLGDTPMSTDSIDWDWDGFKIIPDMYLSIDDKYFIHHASLENNEELRDKILAFSLTENGDIDKTTGREQSITKYKHLTSNKKVHRMKKIFISYSRKDVDYKNELKNHLSMLRTFDIADNWSCEEITIGKWDEQIQNELEESDLIIYMLSSNFFTSKYILEKEVLKGMDLVARDKTKKVLCVIVNHFVGIDKLRDETKTSELQDAILQLADWQYLPYDNVLNLGTESNHEKMVPLSEYRHSDISKPLKQIVEKVAEILK